MLRADFPCVYGRMDSKKRIVTFISIRIERSGAWGDGCFKALDFGILLYTLGCIDGVVEPAVPDGWKTPTCFGYLSV
jgi:hypothetical protein